MRAHERGMVLQGHGLRARCGVELSRLSDEVGELVPGGGGGRCTLAVSYGRIAHDRAFLG